MNLLNANACYTLLQRYFYNPDTLLYREHYPPAPGDKPASYLWALREALTAMIDMSQVSTIGYMYTPDVARHLTALNLYWNATKFPDGYDSYPPSLGGGDLFYDDNAIVAMSYLRWYQITNEPQWLQYATHIFPLLQYGWDSNPTHKSPGGMLWSQGTNPNPMQRGANVTGFAAQVALSLYAVTKQTRYLDFGKVAYAWNRSVLHSPDGLYWNDLDTGGTLHTTYWSYNSGIMIGAGVQLYQVTGDKTFLSNAQGDAHAALSYWGQSSHDWFSQPAIFNAYLFKNLQLLDAVAHDPVYLGAMQAYADTAWTHRDAVTGLFTFAHPTPLLDVAALTQLYACLARG